MNNNSKAHEENDLRLTQLNAIVKAAKLGLWDMWIIKDDPINPVNAFTWSDEFRLLMGYSDEKDFPNLFSSWSERIHPDDFDMVMDRFEKHMLDNTGKTPYDIEYRVFKKNGECIYIRDFCDVIRDENGEAIRVAGAIEDITKRNQDITEIKESQEKLEQREKKLEALNKMAVAFLSQSDTTFETLMTNEVRFITDIMNLDKVSVWRNFEKADGLHSSMIYRWNSEFGGTTEPPPVFKDVTYAQYAPSWEKMLSDGQSINGPSRLMPEREAATLAAFGAVSAFVTPIFFSNAFWGFVLFADGHNERYFDNESAEMMRSAAFLFANAVMRAEMEREIATAEERTKLMLDSSPLGCNIWDQDLNLIACNEAVVNLLGLKNKQEYFERFFDFSPEYQPDGKRSSDEGLRLVKKAFAEGTISFEWMHQKSDGTPLPAEITLVRVNYGSGYVLAGYTRDLSRRKALEKSVAEANERTKILLDSTPLCCQLWDDSFRKIDCNEEAIRLFGFKDKQDFLEGHSELYPEYQPDGQLSVEKAKMYVKQAFTEGYCTFGWTYKLSDGSLLPAQVVLVKVKREDGFVIAGYTRDMREHNKMMKDIEYRDCLLRAVNQAAALLNNSEIESFADNLHQSMKILSEAVDVERVYIWENYTIDSQLYCRQIYEWSENAEPQQDKEFASGIPYSGYISRWGEILPTGKCVNGIVRELSEEEQALLSPQCIISIMVVPIFIKDIFWGFVGFDDCINERIFTEEEEAALRSGGLLFTNALIRNELIKNIHKTSAQLEKALQQANASSKAKGDFLSNMSHEMRTPMNAIIGMTAIGKNANDIEQKNHALNKIGDASSHLLGVINDVLDMAKIEADKLELSPIEYNFERMLQKVVTVISFRVDEKRQSLSVNVEKNIPRFVVGDDQRLAQVITNLLSNAVKFTPEEGSIRLEAFFVGEANGICDLRIEVTDSGIGIASDQHQKIFQSFEQAESGTSRQYGGTGLGLVISKRIVELMEGNIWLESEPGKGSKFSFTVKIGRGKKSPGSLLAPGVNWENIRILVVDDIIETCTQFKDIFSNLGIQCDTALDGQEAWNIIEEHGEYDIYFIDWRMPVMDGIELTRRIKSLKESRPSVVTMITAADWQQIKGEAFEAGVDKYLLKPLFSSMIIDCVNECLGTVQSKDDDTTVGEGEFAGKRILVAEDIEINREILIALLENTGLMIDCAENGKEALTMVASAPEKYDMVFMDIQMPQMDGLEATRCIRALPEHKRNKLPIVAMTANVFQSDIDACHEAGMDGHLGKPLDIDNVLEKLRMYLKAKKD